MMDFSISSALLRGSCRPPLSASNWPPPPRTVSDERGYSGDALTSVERSETQSGTRRARVGERDILACLSVEEVGKGSWVDRIAGVTADFVSEQGHDRPS